MREAIEALDFVVVHRRVHDRDRAPRRLRPAGDDAVREVRGDVLQLRVPAQRLPPPPPGARRRPTGRCRSRRSTPASSRPPACSTDADLAPLRAAADAGRARVRRGVRRGDRGEPAPRRRRAGACCTARSARPCRDGAASAAALWALAHRCALLNPSRRRARRLRRRARGRRARCSTRSSTARPASCSPTTSWTRPGARIQHRRRHACTSPSPSCSPSSPRSPTSGRRATTPSGRSCSRPASAARSPPTPSSATRRGASSDADGALRVAPADAARARPRRRRHGPPHHEARRSAVVTVEVDDAMQPGHLALPNGLGLDHADGDGRVRPASRRTSSRPARTATPGSAPRGTRPSPPASSQSPPLPLRERARVGEGLEGTAGLRPR